jgi:protein-tyrosine phosphatase
MHNEALFTPARLLPWEASLNSRELGGYPTAEGGCIRWKTLVRSESTWRLNSSGQKALVDYGIRTVIDLRFSSELEIHPSPFARSGNGTGTGWPDYFHIPLDCDQDLDLTMKGSPAEVMHDLYCRLLETNRRHVAAVLSVAAGARPGGVLFHCHAGKDRTGLITAMILGAAGVSRELIIQDYSFIHPAYFARRDQELFSQDLTPDQREMVSVSSSIYPETMALTLDYLDRQYGGVQGYLATTPLRGDVLDTLLDRIVEKPAV